MAENYVVGDKLVLKDINDTNNDIVEVHIIGARGGLYDLKLKLIHTEFYRKASVEELNAGRRLTIAKH